MGWSNLNYYRLQGSITSGITLDVANSKAGSAPSGYLTYDDVNYGSTTYAIGAWFYGEYASSITNNRIVLHFTGDSSRVDLVYSGSYDGISYDAWSYLNQTTGSNTFYIDYPYFKLKGIFDNTLWSDVDGFYISAIELYYKVFQKGTTITAFQMNDNFRYVGSIDLMPLGSTTLIPTSGVYDLGSDVYRWRNISIEDFTAATVEINANSFYKIAEYVLSAPVTSIEFSGLSGDSDNLYKIIGTFYVQTQTAGLTSRVLCILNGVSSVSYFSTEMLTGTSGSFSYSDNTTTAASISRAYHGTLFETTFFSKTNSNRDGLTRFTNYARNASTTSAPTGGISSFIYFNTGTAISSIKLYLTTGNTTISSGKISLYALR